MKNSRKKLKRAAIIGIAVLIAVALMFGIYLLKPAPDKPPEIITVSTLERIINVSELSTFTSVYNGIAEVKNEKKPEKTDYYVSYEAKVNAAIDFDKVEFTVDAANKKIEVDIPDVYITEPTVDIASLDFIFYNKKANVPSVTQQAYKACEADVKAEAENTSVIIELAQENAEDVIEALIKPFAEQMEYSVTII